MQSMSEKRNSGHKETTDDHIRPEELPSSWFFFKKAYLNTSQKCHFGFLIFLSQKCYQTEVNDEWMNGNDDANGHKKTKRTFLSGFVMFVLTTGLL